MAYNHEAAKRWLRENIKRSPRLQDIADAFDVPQETLRRYFFRHEGKSISQFIDDELLAAVQHELLTTQRCCNEIARDFNFSYETNAERWFKQRMGITMMEFRKSNGRQCGDVSCVDETKSEVGGQMAEFRNQRSTENRKEVLTLPRKILVIPAYLETVCVLALSRCIPQMITASDYRE